MTVEASLRVDLVRWALPILRERTGHEANWMLPHWWQRWGYAAKALVCVLLRREDASQVGSYGGHEGVEVAHCCGGSTYSPEWGSGGYIAYLAVGPGVRGGWWFYEGEASWP